MASAAAIVMAGCASSTVTAPATAVPATPAPGLPAPPAPVWTTCPTHPDLQCGVVLVPIDYAHPGDGLMPIAVSRARATGGATSSGTMLLNPGGPGESGNQILPVLLANVPADVRAAFDIVSFDPRGTGASSPLRCGTVPSSVTATDPMPAQAGLPLPGTPVFAKMARACATRHPVATATTDTVATARDMDRIRQALGLGRISFYGMSYGTVLGTEYAALFPDHVQTMVLDGAVDMDAPLSVQATEQAPAADRALTHLFATCAAAPACPLGSDPAGVFAGLTTSMTAHPLPAPGNGDTVPVTVGDLDGAALFAVSVPQSTGLFESALTAATHGDGSGLRNLSLQFVTDIDGSPIVDAQWAITCNDTVGHPGPVAAGTLARSLAARYPLLGAFAVTYNLGGCVSWPAGSQPVSDTHPTRSPPVLVIGNTGDPNTPLVGAVHLAALFPHASQLTWDGWGHTWLLSGPSDLCMQGAVSRYLLTGALPAPGTVCA